jgi:hypothetical protein
VEVQGLGSSISVYETSQDNTGSEFASKSENIEHDLVRIRRTF